MNFVAFKKYIVLFTVAAGLTFSSCQKDDEEPTPEPTKKDLLTNKWKVSDVQTSTGTSLLSFPQIQCLTDNIFTLLANNTFTIEEGANVCDTPFEGSGTWSLTENETKLKLEFQTGDPVTADINDVNTTTLKMSYFFADAPIPGTYIVILQKQ